MKAFLILLFFISNVSFCQKLNTKIDPISGDTSVYTDRIKLGSGLKYIIAKTGKEKSLIFLFNTPKLTIVNPNDSISIKLESGEVVKINSARKEISDINGSIYNNSIICFLPNTAADKLLTSGISFIRIPTSESNLDYSIEKKYSDFLLNSIHLIKNK